MKKNYLYLPNASQIRKYIRHISKPTKFVNGLQGTSKTFCKSRTTQSVDLLCVALFQHHPPSPSLNHESLHLTCGSCFVSIQFTSKTFWLGSFILGSQRCSILETSLSWHGQHLQMNCTGNCAKRCVEDKDNSFLVLLLKYLLVLDGT